MTPPLPTLAIHRLVFEVEALDPLHLPAFAGSTLRGAFGAALRRLACMTRAPACAGCGLVVTCPFPRLFETTLLGEMGGRSRPAPYAFEPPDIGQRAVARGATWRFGLRLYGDAIDHLALIVEAMRRALVSGLTTSQSRGRLRRVLIQTGHDLCDLYDAEAGLLDAPPRDAGVPFWTGSSNAVRAVLITPLRLQSNGKRIAADQITLPRLLLDIRRRALALAGVAGERAPPFASCADEGVARTALRWFDWERVSTRQAATIRTGGWLGEMEFGGLDHNARHVLSLGEWIGVGKETPFGFGQFTLQSVEKAALTDAHSAAAAVVA